MLKAKQSSTESTFIGGGIRTCSIPSGFTLLKLKILEGVSGVLAAARKIVVVFLT